MEMFSVSLASVVERRSRFDNFVSGVENNGDG